MEGWVSTRATGTFSTLCGGIERHVGGLDFICFVRRASDSEATDADGRAWSATMQAVFDAGGGIAHHPGIGRARAGWQEAENGRIERLRDAVERAFDPSGHFGDRFLS